MSVPSTRQEPASIQFSCYMNKHREGEQFVAEHVFSYQQEGVLTLDDGTKKYISKPGDFRLVRKNRLVKFLKEPAGQGAFRSISIYFDQDCLQRFGQEFGYKATHQHDSKAVIALPAHPLFKSFIDSLMAYEGLDMAAHQELVTLKRREALLLLLKVDPSLKEVLFDFTEPGKIDLEAFMQKNYHFNVDLKRFAYLTGRSLATFKRDFEKIFDESPSRWLIQKRLKEAYYRIKEKGIAPSDVYLDVGFEDLSHFSFAFKKQFGVAPSRV